MYALNTEKILSTTERISDWRSHLQIGWSITDWQIGQPISKSARLDGTYTCTSIPRFGWSMFKIDASCRVSINKVTIKNFDFSTKATIVCSNEGRQHMLCWHESWKCEVGSGKLHRPEVSASLQSRRTKRRS